MRNFLRRLVRRKPSPHQQQATEVLEANYWIAADFMQRQREGLETASLPFRLTSNMQRTIELRMLWGVYHDLIAEGPQFATNGYDRIALHLAHFLTRDEGLSLADALVPARDLLASFNRGETALDNISKIGSEAFKAGDEWALARFVHDVAPSLEPDAFEPEDER